MTESLAVGVIGAGMISHTYLIAISRAPDLALKAIASRTAASARLQADRYGCAATTVEAILADPDVALIVNLAPPDVHYALGRAVLEAGKHLYSEKPLAASLADAQGLVDLAEARGLLLGCAPDTFLGPAHQAARHTLDDGAIGAVVAGSAAMISHGMEHWHPNPGFFFQPGGGPLLDIGPYLVTQLVNLLGPVAQVAAIGTTPRLERTTGHPDRAGEAIPVAVQTTVNGALLFESGANIAVTLSWDVWRHQRSHIELYGETGSLLNPDPNGFTGPVSISLGDGDWSPVHGEARVARPMDAAVVQAAMRAIQNGIDPMTGQPLGPYSPPLLGDRRGMGVVDMAQALRDGRQPRASGRLALHVLEVLLGLEACAKAGGARTIASRVARPAPVAEAGQ